MRLLLIRHGEIDFNRQRRFCGSTDPPLNKSGITQLHQLKKILKGEPVHQIYCSPLRRARDSARILFGRRRLVVEPALREISFGQLESLPAQEVSLKYPSFYRRWRTRPDTCHELKTWGGETLQECRQRALAFIRKLIRNKNLQNKTIALVTHGGIIKIIVCEILKIGFKNFWSFYPEPASVTTIEYVDNKFCLLARNLSYEKDHPGFRWRP